MYMSCLLIDVGTDPDRPRPGRLWLRNVYRVHQRLCMAFPAATRKNADPQMLRPFEPEHFAVGHVRVERDDHAGFLFRIDPQPGGTAAILVLSALRPDWDYAFGLTPGPANSQTGRPIGNAGHLLAAPPSVPRPVQLDTSVGSRFRFRLVANPTKKTGTLTKEERQAKVKGRHGRRIPVPSDAGSLRSWLERRAIRAGFAVKEITLLQGGYVYANKTHSAAGGHRLYSVRFEGTLEVIESDKFRTALAAGIGPAKAFGFGLLSIAPVMGSGDGTNTVG